MFSLAWNAAFPNIVRCPVCKSGTWRTRSGKRKRCSLCRGTAFCVDERTGTEHPLHRSDCALHAGPADWPEPCNCGLNLDGGAEPYEAFELPSYSPEDIGEHYGGRTLPASMMAAVVRSVVLDCMETISHTPYPAGCSPREKLKIGTYHDDARKRILENAEPGYRQRSARDILAALSFKGETK